MLVFSLANCLGTLAGTLNWIDSRDEAIMQAQRDGKKILLIAGRNDCAECDYMHNLVCESTNPPVRLLIESEYVPWFCNIDFGDDWKPYAVGLTSFPLPLICTIHPTNTATYMDRSVGIQTPVTFHRRLLVKALIQITNANFVNISVSNSVTSLEISRLTYGATNYIERATGMKESIHWVPMTNFVSLARRNTVTLQDDGGGAAYFRIRSCRE